MTRVFRLSLACAVLASLSLCSPARADAPAPSDARTVDAARRAFDAGVERARAGDAEGARILFAQSFAAWPSIDTLRNLAIAEQHSGHFLDAATHFKEYAASKHADPAFATSELPKLLDECEAHLGHLRVTGASGASVTVDGKVTDATSAIDITPGEHTVAIGGVSDGRVVTVIAGQTADVGFGGVIPARAPANDASPRSSELPAPHSPQDRSPTSFWTTNHVFALALTGAAVASLGVAFVSRLNANSNASKLADLDTQAQGFPCARNPASAYCTELRNTLSSQNSNATVAAVGFVGAGVLAAAASVMWLLPSRSHGQSKITLWMAPSISPDSAAVLAGGNF